MKRFVISVVLFFAIPLLLLAGLYAFTDPYRTMREFNRDDFDETNREYFSTELFLQNNPEQQYNAFVFCSSRGSGINSYLWKHLLGDTIRPFVFQSWAEDLVGMEEKVNFVIQQGNHIDYALILVDMSCTFDNRKHNSPVDQRHYLLDGGNKLTYNYRFWLNFIQKPSQWVSAIKKSRRPLSNSYDHIANDRDNDNCYLWQELPPQDSLSGCSAISKQTFLNQVKFQKESDIKVGSPVIDADDVARLRRIKATLDSHHANVKILLSPYYVYQNPMANPKDVQLLKSIFGDENVFDYTQKSELTTDYNYYLDPKHFGRRAGGMILQEMYKQ